MTNEFKGVVKSLRDEGIMCAVWKDKSALLDGVTKDVDLYVSDRMLTLKTLRREGFILSVNSKFSDIGMFHAFKLIQSRYLHIHVYGHLYTGSSWIKQYDFSEIGHRLLTEASSNELALPNEETLFIVEKTRLQIKSAFFLDKVLMRRSGNKVFNELGLYTHVSSNIEFKPIRRLGYQDYIIEYAKALLKRLIPGFGHSPLKGGCIIVVYGSDGSGKSSIVKYLNRVLSPVFRVKIAVLGNVKSSLGLDNLNIRRSKGYWHNEKAIIIALIRLFRTVVARVRAGFGMVVLADRWPTISRDAFDGPRISNNSRWYWLEGKIYSVMPKVDLAIQLEPGLEELLKRNKSRVKTFKESDEEIVLRHGKSKNYTINAKQKCVFENVHSFDEDAERILSLVVEYLNDC